MQSTFTPTRLKTSQRLSSSCENQRHQESRNILDREGRAMSAETVAVLQRDELRNGGTNFTTPGTLPRAIHRVPSPSSVTHRMEQYTRFDSDEDREQPRGREEVNSGYRMPQYRESRDSGHYTRMEKRISSTPPKEMSVDDLNPEDELIAQQHAILKQIQLEAAERGMMTMNQEGTDFERSTSNSVGSGKSAFSSSSAFSSPSIASLPPQYDSAVVPTVIFSVDSSNDVISDSSSGEEEEDFGHYISDPTVIEEQLRIMMQIEQEQQQHFIVGERGSCQKSVSSCDSLESLDSPTGTNYSANTMSTMAETNSTTWSSSVSGLDQFKRDVARKNSKISAYSQDQVRRMYGGKKLHIRGTKSSTSQADAIIVSCPGCQTLLQVSEKAKNLYCTMCQTVSPISLVKEMTSKDDYQIASSLQVQEKEAVRIRTMLSKATTRTHR